jgi:hippurate hydrolase
MISEDFSVFLEHTGGAFVLVGAAAAEPAHAQPTNHSPLARYDDSVVPMMGHLLAELAIRRLVDGGGPGGPGGATQNETDPA